MNILKSIVTVVLVTFCFSSVIVKAQIVWDFEDGNDHGFTLWSVVPATPATDDPNTAGDEAVTGVGGSDGLPDAGHCWTIGPPNQFEGLKPAVDEGEHVVNGVLKYTDANDPFGVFEDPANPSFINPRGQTSYLNTYNLNMWGDYLHSQYNDQIATSPPVLLSDDAMLIVWSYGGGSTNATFAPEMETDRENDGYWERSCGIAVLSEADKSWLASVFTQHRQHYDADTLDLSAFAGQTVILDVVDAFEGAWGWIAIDEIQITNATVTTDVASKPSATPVTYALMQNYPNPFNPTTQIHYTLGKNTKVEIAVYDLLGHKVATLVDGYQNAGSHKVVWDATNVSAGIYVYQMKTNELVESKKMILVK